MVISHHAEFINSICNETWHVADGRVNVTKDTKLEEDE